MAGRQIKRTQSTQEIKQICPICNSEVTFSYKDGEISYYNCPKCGQINLKKEKWRKLLKDPIPTSDKIKIQITCDFCKLRNSEDCYNAGLDATTCGKYKEDMQISNAEKLIMLIKSQEPILFMDQYKTGCAYIEDYGTWKTFVINSKPFKFYLSKLFFKALGRVITTEHLKNGIRTIEAFAREGEQRNLQNRIASIQTEQGLEIWFDMCDKNWRSIQVTKERHVIIEKTPPIFRKYSHQLPLCEPKTYGNDDTNCSSTRLSTPPLSPNKQAKKRGRGKKSCTHIVSIVSIVKITRSNI